MSGPKTRIGFSGDGPEPRDPDDARGARTIIGRDIHMQLPAGRASPRPPAPDRPSAAAPVPAPVTEASAPSRLTDEVTAELLARKTARPDGSRLARYLGRWTKSGRFVSGSQGSVHSGILEVPRDPIGRNLLLVLVVAVVTFLLTLVGVKVHQHFAGDARREVPRPSAPPAPVQASPGLPAAGMPSRAPVPEQSR